jgi:hypothetical protein
MNETFLGKKDKKLKSDFETFLKKCGDIVQIFFQEKKYHSACD